MVVVDAAVLGSVGLMKRVITKADGDAPRLWGWWWAGVVVLLGVDVIRLLAMAFDSTRLADRDGVRRRNGLDDGSCH